MQVTDVMVTDVQPLPATMTLHEVAAFLTRPDTKHSSFPALDPDGCVLGIIDPPAVIDWRRAGKGRNGRPAELLAGQKPVLAHPDEFTEEPIDRMMRANVAHMAVVSRADGRLAGYLGWRDLLCTRSRVKEEETQRVVFYRVG